MVNPQATQGIEALLKEMCMRMERVETKLSSLDKIEARLDKIDSMFNRVDGELAICKDRIDHLKRNAQFLSDIKDEHVALKKKLDTLTTGVESTQTDNKICKYSLQ